MEEMQQEEGLNILEIIRILLQKIKLLILVVIIGAVCGACFGYWRYADVKNYGTSIEFYINPEKPKNIGNSTNNAANAVGSQYGVYGAYGRHVMDAMVKLLSSQSFAEKLMLDGEALPCTDESKAETPNDYYPTLNKDKYAKAEKALNEMQKLWEDIAENHDKKRADALTDLEAAWKTTGQVGSFTIATCEKYLNAYKDEYKEPFAEQNKYKDEDDYNEAKTLYDNLREAYDAFIEADAKRNDAYKDAEVKQKETDDIVEEVLEEWRKTEQYKENLELYNDSVVYSYLGAEEDVENANNLARSFIYVDINVKNDVAFANVLLERVKTVVPDYIEKNMIVPTDYEGTSCTRITRTNDIEYLNPNLARNQAIKFGFLLAFAAGVVAAVIIIIIDMQDKRLRDHEIITRKFNVPVLGIVPTIEEMNQAVELKKQELKKQGKGV
ncbi:MAG: hypothetical protein E7371_05590 [Clostridiales bacterium]|nr:hypothetical protein [Clostridiales bacterium]